MSTMTDAQVRAILKEKKAGKVKQEPGNEVKKAGEVSKSPASGIIGRKRQGEDLKQTTLKFVKKPEGKMEEAKEKKNVEGSDDDVVEVNNVKGRGRWYSHLKAIEFDVLEMEAIRERHEIVLEEMRGKNKELELKIKKCAGHEGEISKLKKKNKELEEKLANAVKERDEAITNEDTQKGIVASLQDELEQKGSQIKDLQLEVADRYDAGFDFAVEQVGIVHPNIDMSEISILKIIKDGKLVEALEEKLEKDGDLQEMKEISGSGEDGTKEG